jgi:hypothetical protein
MRSRFFFGGSVFLQSDGILPAQICSAAEVGKAALQTFPP